MEFTSYDQMADAFARCSDPELFLRRMRDRLPLDRPQFVWESRLWARRLIYQEGQRQATAAA